MIVFVMALIGTVLSVLGLASVFCGTGSERDETNAILSLIALALFLGLLQ